MLMTVLESCVIGFRTRKSITTTLRRDLAQGEKSWAIDGLARGPDPADRPRKVRLLGTRFLLATIANPDIMV
jgi:hypothetical protein